MKIRFRYPFPTDKFTDEGVNYQSPEKHSSHIISQNDHEAILIHRLDSTKYFTHFSWQNKAQLAENQKHDFLITPQFGTDTFQFGCQFSEKEFINLLPNFMETAINSEQNWKAFWSRGGAIDFTGSTDPRANELERRIILSQYLTKIQCAGSQPPQETGLTYNSWYGKPI